MSIKKDELFPWQKEKNWKKPIRVKAIPPKAAISRKASSMSKSEAQKYLDIYSMAKKREILEKIGESLGNAQRQMAKNWIRLGEGIEKVKAKLEGDAGTNNENDSEQVKKNEPGKPLKTMRIDY